MRNRMEELNKAPIRKSFLVIGACAVGAALIGFVLMTFVFGGNSSTPTPSIAPGVRSAAVAPVSTPAPVKNDTLRPGGRDPFSPAH